LSLTDTKIKAAKPEADREYDLPDGNSLYLIVQPDGGKFWKWRYRFGGKQKKMSFGEYPRTSLAKAREELHKNRKILDTGVDPMTVRKATKEERRREPQGVLNPFRETAVTWFDQWKVGKNQKYADNVESRLLDDILPRLGDRPIADIKRREVVDLILAIEARGAADVARRVKQHIASIFEMAMTLELVESTPAAFDPETVLQQAHTENFPRVDEKDLPQLLRKIDHYDGAPLVRLALKLMSLVFVRTGEMIPAQWPQFDFEARMWNIPEEQMKPVGGKKRPHMVPLSKQAFEIVMELHDRRKNDLWVFPGARANAYMSKDTMNVALHEMGFKGEQTGHGFRGIASTMLHEIGYHTDVVEKQLAHKVKGEVKGVYNKALYIGPRTIMMQAWADFLEEARKTGKLPPYKNFLRLHLHADLA
jgi:integrase